MRGNIQKFGKSLLLPISTIAAAGIFLGLAAALQNPAIVGQGFVDIVGVQHFIGFIRRLAGLVFGNLPVFFAISIALGMAKEEKATAAFASLMGFLVFHSTLNYIMGLNGLTAATTSVPYLMESGYSLVDANIINARFETVLGFFTYRMNVFGGVIVGITVAYLHNRFYKTVLPSSINFFGGKRFVPLVTLLVIPLVAVASFFVWPIIDSIISALGRGIEMAGIFGTFVFGFLNRLLIPTGLHHILNQLVRFTPIGGTAVIDGETIVGALNIFNTGINTGASNEILSIGTRFVGQGHMVSVIFGLPAAGLAMLHCSKPENKTRVKALIIAGLAASMLTGITEPLEFLFIFISPILFVFHMLLYGIGYMLMDLLNVSVGGVQGGLIDFLIFGLMRGTGTNWFMIIIVGAFVSAAYYFGFKFLIQKFNIMTPGREDDMDTDTEESGGAEIKDNALIETIIAILGGKENIESVENCMTRLRVTVKNPELISEKDIKKTGASGFVRPSKENIQIVYGLKVDQIATDVKSYLKK